ncbi:hypothetical protein P3S68_005892 [Capsicum galapagoense]
MLRANQMTFVALEDLLNEAQALVERDEQRIVMYSEGLTPTKVLDTLPVNDLKKTDGLPYKKLGSDHLALVSEFEFLEVVGDKKEATEDRVIG